MRRHELRPRLRDGSVSPETTGKKTAKNRGILNEQILFFQQKWGMFTKDFFGCGLLLGWKNPILYHVNIQTGNFVQGKTGKFNWVRPTHRCVLVRLEFQICPTGCDMLWSIKDLGKFGFQPDLDIVFFQHFQSQTNWGHETEAGPPWNWTKMAVSETLETYDPSLQSFYVQEN